MRGVDRRMTFQDMLVSDRNKQHSIEVHSCKQQDMFDGLLVAILWQFTSKIIQFDDDLFKIVIFPRFPQHVTKVPEGILWKFIQFMEL